MNNKGRCANEQSSLFRSTKMLFELLKEKHQLIINITCLVAFLVQVFFVTFRLTFPSHTHPMMEKVDLASIPFPVSFKICLKRHSGEDVIYKRQGYNNLASYFKGESIYNTSIIGWAGHQGRSFIKWIYQENMEIAEQQHQERQLDWYRLLTFLVIVQIKRL